MARALSPEADLQEIGDYIAADNPVRAVSFEGELRERICCIGWL